MNRQHLIKFFKRPIVLITSVILTILIGLIACWTIALHWLSHVDLGMPFDNQYMLTGDIARSSIEAFVNVSLADGHDFYHYYSVTPGESHDLMRFTVPPAILKKILADPSTLCFGTQLQSQPNENAITFMTPVPDYHPLTTASSPVQPTTDYSWLTPQPRHIYLGARCQTRKEKRMTYYRIRVDQSDSKSWIVWLEVYSG